MEFDNICTKINSDNKQFFKILELISNSNIYKNNTQSLNKQHKIGHIQRVMLFSNIIAQNENLDEELIKILLVSAAFHDCGKVKDRDNGEHGVKGADIVGKYFKNNINNQYQVTIDEIPIIQVSIEYHTVPEHIHGQIDEVKLKELCNKYNVADGNYEKVKQVSAILKDADALDRIRFISESNLNPNYLRTKIARSRSMIEFSKKINEAYAEEIINFNYANEQNIFENKVKLLHYLRNKHKNENAEIDIPLYRVIQIFNDNKKSYNINDKYEENIER